MLKIEDVKFPIKFISFGIGEIEFKSPSEGIWNDYVATRVGLEWFIDRHNSMNPENSHELDYHYIMSEEQSTYKVTNGWKVGRALFSSINIKEQEIKPSIQCTQIENMPVSATLKGVQLDDESWFEVTATPKAIEVYDDVVVLLLHYGGCKHKTVAGEISIKRGTLVRYEVK